MTAQQGHGELRLAPKTLNLKFTLTNGQMFRWRERADGWWEAVSGVRVVSLLALEDEEGGAQRFAFETQPVPGEEAFVRHFLRLDLNIEELYGSWRDSDPYLGGLAERFAGLRLVKQEPEECLLSFICSTANSIPRIMRAVATIARTWGEPIRSADGKVTTHAFPAAGTIAALDPEEVAEKTGLEWRAANLIKVARQITERPAGWLEGLSDLDYATARGELMRIEGVGPKIADCVCLFAMRKDGAVPVDTHVWQLTRERYLPALRGKSLTSSVYAQILHFYQTRFVKAGWAQQYLFYDHLLESRERRESRNGTRGGTA